MKGNKKDPINAALTGIEWSMIATNRGVLETTKLSNFACSFPMQYLCIHAVECGNYVHVQLSAEICSFEFVHVDHR